MNERTRGACTKVCLPARRTPGFPKAAAVGCHSTSEAAVFACQTWAQLTNPTGEGSTGEQPCQKRILKHHPVQSLHQSMLHFDCKDCSARPFKELRAEEHSEAAVSSIPGGKMRFRPKKLPTKTAKRRHAIFNQLHHRTKGP